MLPSISLALMVIFAEASLGVIARASPGWNEERRSQTGPVVTILGLASPYTGHPVGRQCPFIKRKEGSVILSIVPKLAAHL